MNRLISFAHLSALALSPPELIRLAAASGFSAVGLRLGEARRGDVVFQMLGESALRRETARVAADLGIAIHDVEVLCLYPDSDPVDYLPLFEATADLGARYVILNSEDRDEARMIGTFARLCEHAAAFGLTIAIEFMRYRAITSLAQANRIVERAGQPNGAIVLDTLHFFRAGTDVSALSALPPGRVAFLQLSDAPATPPADDAGLRREATGGREYPGEGGLPLAAILAALPPGLTLSIEIPRAGEANFPHHAGRARAAVDWLLASLPGR